MDLRDVLLDDLKRQPGMTAEEVAALHPEHRPARVKKMLRALCRSWGEAYYKVCTGDDGGQAHRRFRFYPKTETEGLP